MHIWLINIGEEIPSDSGTPRLLRTGILAEHMARRGHKVIWFNSTLNHQRKTQRADRTTIVEMPQGYRVVLLHGRTYDRNISLARIVSQIENAREFSRIAPTLPKPDAILCGYPTIELAEAAVRFANAHRVPIAVDFRDMWPEVISEQANGLKGVLAAPFLANWRRAQRHIVRNATAVIGVTDAFVDWALATAKRRRGPLDRSFHLATNPEPPTAEAIADSERYWQNTGLEEAQDVIVGNFAGTLSRRLDIATLVAGAMGLSKQQKARFKLVICGKGDLDGELRAMAEGDRSVVFAGWRNAAELHVLLRRCHFGTLPYRSTSDFVRHYPNKVGEYLGAGLPIATCLQGQVRTLLSEREIGWFYDEVQPASATACLERLIDGRSLLQTQRGRARATYQELFDSTHIYREFCDYLERLGAAARASMTGCRPAC